MNYNPDLPILLDKTYKKYKPYDAKLLLPRNTIINNNNNNTNNIYYLNNMLILLLFFFIAFILCNFLFA
jgi:hypothetical protein